MISFRFHVVSITAVFLAIAIGVVVGTTYVDGAVVDGLRNRINSVEDNLDTRREENEQLEDELEDARGYIEATADFAVTDRLTDVPVLLVAVRGVDESVVERTVALARRAGATVPGVAWIETGWSLEDEDARTALAEIVDGDPDDDPEDLWAAAWEAAVEELAAADADPLDGTSGAPTGTEPTSTVLAALTEGGFLNVDAFGDSTSALTDLAGEGPRVLVLTGPRAQAELAPVVPVLVAAVVDGDLPTVVADVHVEAPEAPGRGEDLREVLPEELRERLVLVDHADLLEGQVSAVLALAAVADAQLLGTQYGYGSGAASVLPSWTTP
jgi:hypothetical protein